MSYFDNNKAFGITTVLDVKVYDLIESNYDGAHTPAQIAAAYALATPKCVIDHLQVATLSVSGPDITIQGGKGNNTLIKAGKAARCEMTDALGQADALVELGGAILDAAGNLTITEKFPGPVALIGNAYVVDKETGRQVPVKVIMYKFLPDAIPTFTFDAGNASTFDLNGDLLSVNISLPSDAEGTCAYSNEAFFSIIPEDCALPGTSTYAVTIDGEQFGKFAAGALVQFEGDADKTYTGSNVTIIKNGTHNSFYMPSAAVTITGA